MGLIRQLYKLVEDPTKVLRVIKDEDGWLHIEKLPFDRNNIFFSKEEVEMVVGKELEFYIEKELD